MPRDLFRRIEARDEAISGERVPVAIKVTSKDINIGCVANGSTHSASLTRLSDEKARRARFGQPSGNPVRPKPVTVRFDDGPSLDRVTRQPCKRRPVGGDGVKIDGQCGVAHVASGFRLATRRGQGAFVLPGIQTPIEISKSSQ